MSGVLDPGRTANEIARPMRLVVSLALLTALLPGCPETDPAERPTAHEATGRTNPTPTTGTTATPAALPFVDGERRVMGTVFVIRTLAPRERAEPAIDAAYAEIQRLEGVLSEWIPTSDISRVNAAAGGAAVPIGPDAWANVTTGIDISRRSEGAFDLTWAALRDLYDFHAEHPVAPNPTLVRRRLGLVRWQDVELNEAEHSVRLRRAGMAIGTGAIGKGYALDRAREILLTAGVADFMIYGGGQVTVHGRRGDRAWRVGIQHPRRNQLIASFEATDVSISTSGDYEHSFFDDEGHRVHHIVDPGTGLPARKTISVTVISPSGMNADALSTAVFVLGPEAGIEMLAGMDGVQAAVVGADCVLHTTPGLRDRLRFETPLEPGDVVPGCRGVP